MDQTLSTARAWRTGRLLLLVLALAAITLREAAADYSLSWCRYDKTCFGSLEYHAATEACFWAVDGAMPYKAAWRFSGQHTPPPERVFLGFKVINLRKGIIRVVGDKIVAPDAGKTSGRTTYLYSCDWHAIDQRISAMRVVEARQAPGKLGAGLRRPDCRRYDCYRPPAWAR